MLYNRTMQAKIRERTFRNGKTLSIFQADLLECVVDCIIYGATPGLQLKNNMGKRINDLDRQVNSEKLEQAGYVSIHEGCRRWVGKFGPISAEKPAFTSTCELPFQTLIHTIAPVWNQHHQDLVPAYRMLFQALDLADLLNLRSVATSPQLFTNTGTPAEKTAHMLIAGTADYLQTRDTDVNSIWLIISPEDDPSLYAEMSENLL